MLPSVLRICFSSATYVVSAQISTDVSDCCCCCVNQGSIRLTPRVVNLFINLYNRAGQPRRLRVRRTHFVGVLVGSQTANLIEQEIPGRLSWANRNDSYTPGRSAEVRGMLQQVDSHITVACFKPYQVHCNIPHIPRPIAAGLPRRWSPVSCAPLPRHRASCHDREYEHASEPMQSGAW